MCKFNLNLDKAQNLRVFVNDQGKYFRHWHRLLWRGLSMGAIKENNKHCFFFVLICILPSGVARVLAFVVIGQSKRGPSLD